MTRRKRRMSHRLILIVQRCAASIERRSKWMASRCWAAACRTVRPKSPAVVVDSRRRQAGKLRAAVRRAARTYARALGVPLDLEVPRARAGAPVVELRPDASPPEGGHERSAIPIERIENKAS